jgi:hypothetical protein
MYRGRAHLMPCISMFSRFKADRSGGGGGIGSYGGGGGSNGSGGGAGGGAGGSSLSQTLLEGNAITTFFEIGRQTATAGPGYLWKVHDAYRKSDGKVDITNYSIHFPEFHPLGLAWHCTMHDVINGGRNPSNCPPLNIRREK